MTDLFPQFARIVKSYHQTAIDAALTKEQQEVGLALTDEGDHYNLLLKDKVIAELPKNEYFTYDNIRAAADQKVNELISGISFEKEG